MENSFTTTLFLSKTPKEVFDAINNPHSWWSEEITGETNVVNGIFHYHFKDVHSCKIKVVELIEGKKVVWHVLENNFNFTKDKSEWIDTNVIFDISREEDKTKLVFTHEGLVPEYECYEACYSGWTNYIQSSLKNYINAGEGHPNRAGEPQTETERKLAAQ